MVKGATGSMKPSARGRPWRWIILAVICGACATVDNDRVSAPLTFAERCAQPSVVKCFGFDSADETDRFVYPPYGLTVKRARVDTEIKASGAGSLRFEIPSNTGPDTSGSFWQNFSDDLSVQFGEGDEFYVQWRQRFSPEFLDTVYRDGGGWKQAIISEGDRPGKVATRARSSSWSSRICISAACPRCTTVVAARTASTSRWSIACERSDTS